MRRRIYSLDEVSALYYAEKAFTVMSFSAYIRKNYLQYEGMYYRINKGEK